MIDSMQTVFIRPSVRRFGWLFAGASVLVLQFGRPALAGDPFRPNNPHNISDTSEQMFYAIFRDGNYADAQTYLENADGSATSDPMFHAMGAAFAYLEDDWDGLLEGAMLTQQAAVALKGADPLRGNLYEAVGIFLEGAHILQTEGIAQGTPKALAMLQSVFDLIDRAEEINPEDPELNLLKGYMDLLLAVNLPFANPEKAIDRLSTYGYPTYVSYRGVALGYRDLDRNEEALEAVNSALEAAPDNPDLIYLKAQILRRLGQDEESVDLFNQALEYADQLPASTARQIALEGCQAEGERLSTCKERIDG